MVSLKGMKSHKGRSIRLQLMYLLSIEIGLHQVNGTHLTAGLGLGPLEISTSLHNWEKW